MEPRKTFKSKKMLWFPLLVILAIAVTAFFAWGAKPAPLDTDGDGIPDASDICPFDALNDIDSDGFCTSSGDCNDNDFEVNPDATELCDDGIDNNCDGFVDEGCDTTDTDSDGYPDSTEQYGITLSGMTLVDGSTWLPPCADPPADRSLCVDWQSPDLFVIIERATSSSNIPSYPYSSSNPDPLAFVAALPGARDTGGLGIATHELIRTSATNQAVAGHYAVRIAENLDPDANLFGLSTPGLPNPSSTATVWTEKIKAWIDETCAGATCIDEITGTTVGPNDPLTPLHDAMIINIINHEIGHLISLATGEIGRAHV